MQRFFTKQLFLVLLTFGSMSLFAQEQPWYGMRVTSGSNAGFYNLVPAFFGDRSGALESGVGIAGRDATAMPNLGCEELINPDQMKDKVVFIDRGTCAFLTKITNAQNAGASAVIICNNAPNAIHNALLISLGSGYEGVTIPVYHMALENCTTLRGAINAGTLEFEFATSCTNADKVIPEGAFWGTEAGQGDFSNGLDGWEIGTDDDFFDELELWRTNEFGKPVRDRFGLQMRSATVCDGSAMIDLEELQWRNNPLYFDGALEVPQTYYEGYIISPSIDCSGRENVSVQFSLSALRLNSFNLSGRFLEVSFFDGDAWSAATAVDVGPWPRSVADIDNINMPRTITLPVPQFANKANCRVRIWAGGDLGFVMIDDFFLIDRETVDVLINPIWVASPPTPITPASQVSEMPFLADVSNLGVSTATNVVLKAEIKNAAGDVEGTLENEYGDIPGATVVENKPFPSTFTPPAEEGVYTVTYSISSDNENGTTTNNVWETEFTVSNNHFSRMLSDAEFGSNYLNGFPHNWGVTVSNDYSITCVYYVEKAMNVESARFGIANAAAEVNDAVQVRLDLFELQSREGLANPANRTHVAVGSTITSSDLHSNFRDINVPLYKPTLDGELPEEGKEEVVRLKGKTHYAITATALPFEASTPRVQFLGGNSGVSTNYLRSLYFLAANLAFDSLGLDRYVTSTSNRALPSQGTQDIIGQNLGDLFSIGAGLSRVNSYLPLVLDVTSSTYDIAIVGEAKLFPNPASREFYVDVTLDKPSAQVRIDLVTMDGRLATSRSYSNVQDSRLKFDLGGVPSGTYTAMIHTDNGVLNKKVIVQH